MLERIKKSGEIVASGHTIETLPDGRQAFVWMNTFLVGLMVDGKRVYLPKEKRRYVCNGKQVYDSDERLLPNEAMEASVQRAVYVKRLGLFKEQFKAVRMSLDS